MYELISVLIADDEKLVRNTIKAVIPWQKLGVDTVYEAEDGLKALELSKRVSPSIIISDIKMPHMNGMDFAYAIRRLLPDSKLVFFSAYTDKEYLKGAIHLQVDGYIEKPLDPEEITQLIASLVKSVKQNQAATNPNSVFFYGAPYQALANQDVFTIQKSAFSEFGSLLRQKEQHAVHTFLDNLYVQMENCHGTDPDYIRNVFSRLAIQVENAAELHGAQRAQAVSSHFIYAVATFTELAELKKVFSTMINDLFSELSEWRLEPVSAVHSYLQENYSNADLSVNKVAQHLNFNAAYLCAVYKKKTQKTINTALTEIRIEAAKKLLAQTSMKLYEVATAVGYNDGKYFAKVFTKEVGIPPRQYRERHYEKI